MGKQRKHRQARQDKEQVRQPEGKGPQALSAPKAQVPNDPPAATAPAPTSAPQVPQTVAGKGEYDAFFRLYNLVVRSTIRCASLKEALDGKAGGIYFLPLGFIPGPAILLSFKEGKVQTVEATPDVKKGMKIPTPWQKVEELPARVREALEEWRAVVEGMGYEPSPWNAGFARRALEGQVPSKYLTMAMPHFRYRPGDKELPLGVVLVPAEGGMKLERVHNPGGIPDVPAMGTLSLAILKGGRGPIQKLLRTWTLMEVNYFNRYGGQNSEPRPHWSGPKPETETKTPTRRPTW